MAKQQTCQRFIYKIHSSRLRQAKWKLTLTLSEARKNKEMVSLADSQVLTWLDKLNGISDADETAKEIKAKIRMVKKEPNSVSGKRQIKQLYAELDAVQFKPDYMCLIIDKTKDYTRACKGFSINGLNYKRLLGTNGGIKNSTVVFVSERYSEELNHREDNGRDLTKPMVPAKLEAYKALSCSASSPVSFPNGILIVSDCETDFKSDVYSLTDEQPGEPVMKFQPQASIHLNESDGYGIMLPSLAKRWSDELNLGYTASGMNTRFSFEKGMVFTFDFLDFAENVAHKYTVKDAWGKEVDIRNVELILTTSMVKLWDSYRSCTDYLKCSLDNDCTFRVTKVCPEHLESERCTNYQFLQSYELSDDDITKLIEPTMTEFKEILNDDWRKAVLFLKGDSLREDNLQSLENNYIKALMIEPQIFNDPYVRNGIYRQIQKRINEAKVGVLKVHGNYSIVSGDPYALCQSIFGLPVTGILKAGEIYNKYWVDQKARDLACYRAPMSCHENIRCVHPNYTDEAAYWYRYMTTCTIFNAWDTCCDALNGMDKDGDLVMLTDNEVLVNRHRQLPTLMCVQRRAEKIIVTEDDLIKSNIVSFGSDIGQITNRITSMFEVQSRYDKGSREYSELEYRIQCGQLFQQNAIDKAKGIIAKPMPKDWYDRHAVNSIEDDEQREFYKSIVADKKPYFMRYIYPALMKEYKTYITTANKNSMREFHMTIDDLLSLSQGELTPEQETFLRYYRIKMPTGNGNCTMNQICRRFEDEFDGCLKRYSDRSKFDYSIMKSNVRYTPAKYNEIKKLYEEYCRDLQNYTLSAYYNGSRDELDPALLVLRTEFARSCEEACPNSAVLCNILLDLCYGRSSSKKFVWDLCGETIIHNLLERNNHIISAPVPSQDGKITFAGKHYTMIEKEIEI